MTDADREKLRELAKRWHDYNHYSDDYEYSSGFEDGMQEAAWELEDFLNA